MNCSFPIHKAGRILRDGGVIAYPTEGVYGLGCIPYYRDSVQRIFAIKGRSAKAGLILIAPAIDYLVPWIAPTEGEIDNLLQGFDHPVTWVVSARADTPPWLTGGRDTLAVRITDHPVVAALCETTGSALVSTSANRTGRPPARSITRVRKLLGNEVDCVVPGALGNAAGPSEIRMAQGNRVLRPAAGAGAG